MSRASGAYCVEDFAPPFCPRDGGEGDARCCLDAQYAAAATAEPQRVRPRPLVRLRARRVKNTGDVDDSLLQEDPPH